MYLSVIHAKILLKFFSFSPKIPQLQPYGRISCEQTANAAHGVRLATAVGIKAKITLTNNIAIAEVIGRVGGAVDSPVGKAVGGVGEGGGV